MQFDADKEDSSEDEEEKRRKEKFKTIISSKQQEKEIKASIPMEKRSTGKMPSATGSLSSIQSSVSSAQVRDVVVRWVRYFQDHERNNCKKIKMVCSV